jgi:RNA-binding protein
MTLDSKKRSRLKSEAQKLKTTIEVGKSGLTDAVVAELKEQLERHGLVKVGLRPAATHEPGRDVVANELATRSGGDLVEVRGNTAVYWKQRGGQA